MRYASSIEYPSLTSNFFQINAQKKILRVLITLRSTFFMAAPPPPSSSSLPLPLPLPPSLSSLTNIGDVYEDQRLTHYYSSNRRQAAAFLMAMGAKALALWDISWQAPNGPALTQGLDAEARLAHTMVAHRFRMLLLVDGLWAQKRARNGRVRPVHLTLKTAAQKGFDYLEYPASTGGLLFSKPKVFRLTTLRRCEIAEPCGGDSSGSSSRLLLPPVPSSSASSSTPDMSSPPVAPSGHRSTGGVAPQLTISLINDDRRFTLQFETDEITSFFADFVTHIYLQRPHR